MKKTIRNYFPLLSFLLIAALGCSTVSNQGVEVGNPTVTGKNLTIVPDQGDEIYVIQFEEPPEADVTQILSGEYETIPVNYTEEDLEIFLKAAFSNGTEIETTIGLSEGGDPSLLSLMVNGEETPASFSSEDSELVCPADSENVALTIADTICSRIVACNSVFTCGECHTEVLTVNGLAKQFGGTLDMSLEEVSLAIESGDVTVDEEALSGCLADLAIVPCPLVQESFNDETEPNYSQVREIIPKPSCAAGVLKGK